MVLAGCLALSLAFPAAAQTTKNSARPSTSKSVSSAKTGKKPTVRKASKKRSRSSWRTRQQAIESMRVREIQSALIRARYLDGQPSGTWDARTKAAMQRFQNDNGWQTKRVPDSRALIKLGLGPARANLINPETAVIGMPEPGKGGAQVRE